MKNYTPVGHANIIVATTSTSCVTSLSNYCGERLLSCTDSDSNLEFGLELEARVTTTRPPGITSQDNMITNLCRFLQFLENRANGKRALPTKLVKIKTMNEHKLSSYRPFCFWFICLMPKLLLIELVFLK